MKVFLLFLTLSFLIAFMCLYLKSGSSGPKASPRDAPTICLTINDKRFIPSYIYDQYKMYAPEYRLEIFDDGECVDFLNKHYGDAYGRKFLSIRKGSHRADFFRYAYLYEKGGVYLDVKTILLKPLREIFRSPNLCYLVLSMIDKSIYNGIICTPPRNPYMMSLLKKMFHNNRLNDNLSENILFDTFQAYDVLREIRNNQDPTPGFNKLEGCPDSYIFVEKNEPDPKAQKDRYGYNTFAFDMNHEKMFKIRDPNYTENYQPSK